MRSWHSGERWIRNSWPANWAASPGTILALCLSGWSLCVIVLAILGVKDALSTLKSVSYVVVAWLARDRIDAVAETWEGSAGWHRAAHLIELFIVGSLVVLGIDALIERLGSLHSK